ncbi:MAG: septum formation inhibitor Maf, partial [Bacteroidetes bacterium]
MKYLPLWPVLLVLYASCHAPDDAPASVARSDVEQSEAATVGAVDPRQFTEYWYTGQGELNSYALTQWRYGEPRAGEAVLVFVTEPFSQRKQVKLDRPEADPTDAVSVLKLNHIRKFPT